MEAKFPYFTKENPSPLGLYRNPPTFLQILVSLTPHSHGASASTPLIYFEWSDIKRCRAELWVRRVASLALLAAEVENFSTFQPIRSPYANTL